MKVCHIVSWYPNKWDSNEAIWTKRHIDALQKHCENDVFHVQVKSGKFKYQTFKTSERESAFILSVNSEIWYIKELLTTLLLCYVLLFKISRKKYDIFNFQITYPLLTYSKLVLMIIRKPIVITEHWSAYHLNFGVKKELKRIKRIFKNKKLKFICVSNALVKDIENFCKSKIDAQIVPNVIDTNIFKNENLKKTQKVFFMVSFWKTPKDPFTILSIFNELNKKGLDFGLVIGGYGPQLNEMKNDVKNYNLLDKVKFIGKLNSTEIAENFNKSDFFIHKSNYEVASVVCTESLCCGVPVLASNVGGIVEYVNDNCGVLIDDNYQAWKDEIELVLTSEYRFDSELISAYAKERFSEEVIGEKYFNALANVSKQFYNS